MFRYMRLITILCLVALLAACAPPASALKPGDKLGDMIVTVGKDDLRSIGEFCPNNQYMQPDEKTAHPATASFDCIDKVPNLPRMYFGDGWGATSVELLNENWSAIAWEIYIDGHRLDLPAFGTQDKDDGKVRRWNVELDQLSLGSHTTRTVTRMSHDIFDGMLTYPAGTYDTTYKFTVIAAP